MRIDLLDMANGGRLFLLRRVKESVETSRSHIKINNTIISLIFFVGEFASLLSGCVAA